MKWVISLVAIAAISMAAYIVVGKPIRADCKDGTVSYSKHRSGTCSRHGGVEKWR